MKKIIVLVFIVVGIFGANAQYRLDIGGRIGAANYLGDIGGKLDPRPFIFDLQIPKTRFGLGGFARYSLMDLVSVSAGLQYNYITGADSLSDQPERFSRNLSFRNQIIEAYLRGEVHFLRIRDLGRTGRYLLGINVYGFIGIGGFYHNPQANYQGSWVSLQPLQTEGKKYSRFQPTAPVGGGAFITLARVHRIGLDLTWNFTITDYLDDVSGFYRNPSEFDDPTARALADRSFEVNPDDPRFIGTAAYSQGTASRPEDPARRGNPDNWDSYVTAFATYSYVIKGKSDFRRKKYDFVTGKVKKVRSRAKF